MERVAKLTKKGDVELSSDAKIIDVDTGEFHVSSESIVLQSIALGSCVALMVYERDLKIGGLAHIMLPGQSPKTKNDTKYAKNAIEALFDSARKLGANIADLEISMIGGANVLGEGDIPDKVIDSVLGCLKNRHLEPSKMRVGGTVRRSAFLDISTGRVLFTEGESLAQESLKGMERA